MSYRVEISSTARAICNGTRCKKEQTKIPKGELRQGTMVTIQEHTSMRWRHWGCVTPMVINNWAESSGMDMELVDGFEELPSEAQAKVKRALEQGHVDDEDWNGDLEMNRYNPAKPMQGMFVKASAKKKKKNDGDDKSEDEAASPSKKPSTKKRGRAKVEDDEVGDDVVEPAPKKTKRGKKAMSKDEPRSEPAAPSRSKKGKKAIKDDVLDGQNEPIAPPIAKKGRSKKAQAAVNVDPDTNGAPALKGKGKKKPVQKTANDDHVEKDVMVPKPKNRQRRGRAAAAHHGEET